MSVAVYRWTFDDGAGTTYTVPINPKTMSKLRAARAISTKVTTAVTGQALFFEGQRPPQQINFAGTLIDKAHYDALDWWTYNTGRITITDHFLRKLSVVHTDFDAEPKYTTQYYWRHDYTVTGLCYAVDASNAILGPGL
jgi:hypothetical protein